MATPTTARSAPRTAALLHPLAVAAALRLAATDASADVRYEGGGDCAGAPMYRALNYGYIYDSASSDNGKGSAEGRIGFFASPETGHSWGELFDGGFEGTLSETGAGDYSWTLPTVALLSGDMDIGSGTTITADHSHHRARRRGPVRRRRQPAE